MAISALALVLFGAYDSYPPLTLSVQFQLQTLPSNRPLWGSSPSACCRGSYASQGRPWGSRRPEQRVLALARPGPALMSDRGTSPLAYARPAGRAELGRAEPGRAGGLAVFSHDCCGSPRGQPGGGAGLFGPHAPARFRNQLRWVRSGLLVWDTAKGNGSSLRMLTHNSPKFWE